MGESERNYLEGSIWLSRYEDGHSPERYDIIRFAGEGGSAVCYDATRTLNGNKEIGKLKEFYPVDFVDKNRVRFCSLERLRNGQLVPKEDTNKNFEKMCKEYLAPYKKLNEVMADNADNQILKRYIQHSEILYGYIDDMNCRKPTVYIWSPGVYGEGFDSYLKKIRENLKINQEMNLEKILLDILTVIETLTDCIVALHTSELLHLDIKPSNFLVPYNSDFKIDPNDISLFDINTLCSVKSMNLRASGTKGYCAPEVAAGKADNRSDIYSIGAMLFNAIVIADAIPDGLYRDDYYTKISGLVKDSALFSRSKTNSDESLVSQICTILEKCLAKEPKNRYQACSDLKMDLENAKKRLNNILRPPVKESIEDLSDPTVVIQKLLYEHPLYEAIDAQAKDINVLVIGLDPYGQKFIDICLQSGQMSGVKLNIVAVSDDPKGDSEAYLHSKPALSEFININGSMKGEEENAYATLDFKQRIFSSKMSCENCEIIQSLIKQSKEERKEYNYIFVSLGEEVNASVAEEISKKIGHKCPVCYVCQKKEDNSGTEEGQNKLYPVCVNVPVDVALIDQIGEMAFNTYISWKDSPNIDVAKERKNFFEGKSEEDKYNRTSSLAFALSVKYKLHSVQIECSDLLEAAQKFSEQILEIRSTNEKAKKKFDRLVDLEHRRWLIEHAVDGWEAPRNDKGELDLEACVERGSVKDNVRKTHPCMVRGSESSPLSDPKYQENNHSLWNTEKIDDKLDDLDRMSIELHRCFRNNANKWKNDDFFEKKLGDIHTSIPSSCNETERVFKHFQFALNNIIHGVESYSRQYGYYQNIFKKSLSELPSKKLPYVTEIKEDLAAIERHLFPIIESNLYRNYKANDEALIKKIPFILTNCYKPTIVAAFEDGKYQNGRNEAVFANVAAASILTPKSIKYFYYFDKSSEINLLIRKLNGVLNYFSKRDVYPEIEMVIACLSEVSDEIKEDLKKGLEKLSETHMKEDGKVCFEFDEKRNIHYVNNYQEAEKSFIKFLNELPVKLYDGSNPLFPSAYDNGKFTDEIERLKIPYFEFDWRHKEFSKRINCEYLKYVKDASFIRIRDMFALMNASDNRFNLPEYGDDYKKLWNIYTGEYIEKSEKKFEYGVGNWNRLCACLEKYESKQKPLAKLKISKSDSQPISEVVYWVRFFCLSATKNLIEKLKEYGVLKEESGIKRHTHETCKAKLIFNSEYKEALDAVFDAPNKDQILCSDDGIAVFKYYNAYTQEEIVEIKWNALAVKDADLDSDLKGKYESQVLEQLKKENYIRELKISNNKVSFEYQSTLIKNLLTNAGAILEVYAYYEVLKTGYFDDVACGYEFSWESGDVKNELDLVLTKGFRSIIVECKAVEKLKLDYYHKLHSIADQFGIGTIKVLLGNTYSYSNAVTNEQNEMQRIRGSQLYIETISNEKDIINIGETLKKLMEESK